MRKWLLTTLKRVHCPCHSLLFTILKRRGLKRCAKIIHINSKSKEAVMFIRNEDKGGFGSFKFGYSRGMPSHMAPKLFTSKQQEEYLLTSILSHQLLFTDVCVTGVIYFLNEL